jgi:hypothetical protein
LNGVSAPTEGSFGNSGTAFAIIVGDFGLEGTPGGSGKFSAGTAEGFN